MELPAEVTDIQRLRLRPGDALVIRLTAHASPEQARVAEEKVRAILGLDDSTPVLVLPAGSGVEVLDASDGDRIRDAMAEAQEHPGGS